MINQNRPFGVFVLLPTAMGLLLDVVVHPADIQDRGGAKLILEKVLNEFPSLELVWADGGYR